MVISMLAIGGVAFTGNAAAANGNVPTSDFTVQAGGVDQAGGGGSITLEDTTDGFDASSGTTTIQLPTGSDVTFDQQNSSLAVGGTAVSVSNARFQNKRTISVDVSGGNDDPSEDFTVSGIRYKASPNAGQTDTITASFGIESGTVDVSTAGPSVAVQSANVVRGSEQAGGVSLAIETEATAEIGSPGQDDAIASDNTQPFVAAGDNITVSIEGQYQDQLSFDQSNSVTLESSDTDDNGDDSQSDGNSFIGAIGFTDSNTLEIQADKDIPNDAQYQFTGIQFNSTGVGDDKVSPEFASALNVTTTPKFGTGAVTVQTGSNINTEAPTVRFTDGGDGGDAENEGSNGLSPGSTQQASPQDTDSDDVVVEIQDDGNANSEIASGTVTIALPSNNGVTFDKSQNVEVDYGDTNLQIEGQTAGDGVARSDSQSISVGDNQISFDIDTGSQGNGDVIHVGSADGSDDNPTTANIATNPLKFNVSSGSSASNVNLTVTTPGGAANIVQNTSTAAEGSSYDLDVRNPTLVTNDNNVEANDGGNLLTLGNNNDGETGIDPTGPNDIVLQSEVNNDLVDGNGNNITVTIPQNAPFTFDKSQDDNSGTLGLSGDIGAIDNGADDGDISDEELTIVDDRTLNITFDSDNALTQDDDIVVTNIQYNATGGETGSAKLQAFSTVSPDVSFESANFINVTSATGDNLQSDADQGTTFGSTGDGATTVDVTVGNSQVSTIRVRNSTGVGDNGLSNLGGARVDLGVTDSPDSGSASDISLNTSTVTTASDGTAEYNATVADSAVVGTYNVTASLASNASVNVTTQYNTQAGTASQFNVTGIDNAVIDQSGLGSSPSETEVAAYQVRIEDAGGNIVSGTDVDVSVQVGDGQLEQVNDQIAGDGSRGAGTTLVDGDNDGRTNYDASADGGTVGEFFVFASSESPGDVNVTISESGVSDTGTATVFDAVDSVSVEPESSSIAPGDSVNVTATAQTSDGTTVEVPRLTRNDLTSDNTTVLQRTSISEEANGGTFANGTIEATFDAQSVNGTANITANIAGATGDATITVEEDAPAYYTLKLSNSIADRDVHAAIISIFSTHRQSGSTALLPHSVYRYTRTHTGGQR